MKNKTTLLNMISSLLLQLVSTVSGLIVPRIILSGFGSEVNGLISSLGQILSYITLMEGGLTGVVLANLYKPLVEGDTQKVSSLLSTARSFYRKIGMIFVGYTVVIASVYPVAKKTSFDYWYIWCLTVIISVTLLIQYLYSLSLQTLLDADKKVYVVSFTKIVITISNVILVLITVKVWSEIHLIKLISGALYILQPVVYGRYIKKHYDIDWKAPKDTSLIKNRWDGFAINLAAFIHGCTDIVILTIFTDLQTVSVYSVYLLVVGALRSLIISVLDGLNPTLGQAYARGDKEELNTRINLYEYIDFLLVFFLFTVCALLITPFVLLYTQGIVDANYNQPLFGVLLVLSEALYILKFPHLNLAYVANKFKEITVPAYVEAAINIGVSIVIVKIWGLVGVVIGTSIAMLYRMAFHVAYSKKLTGGRSPLVFYRKLILFAVATAAGVGACLLLYPFQGLTIPAWILHGIVYTCVLGVVYLALSLACFREELRFFIRYLKRK